MAVTASIPWSGTSGNPRVSSRQRRLPPKNRPARFIKTSSAGRLCRRIYSRKVWSSTGLASTRSKIDATTQEVTLCALLLASHFATKKRQGRGCGSEGLRAIEAAAAGKHFIQHGGVALKTDNAALNARVFIHFIQHLKG